MSDEWKINNIQFYFQKQRTKADYGTINARVGKKQFSI